MGAPSRTGVDAAPGARERGLDRGRATRDRAICGHASCGLASRRGGNSRAAATLTCAPAPVSPRIAPMSDLRVEFLYTLECPHHEATWRALHRVLSEGAIETPIQRILVGSMDDAEFLGFSGSPTIRLNGEDIVPVPEDTPVTMACRLYDQPDGSLAGTIPEEIMRAVIRRTRSARFQAFQRDEAALHRAAAEENEHDSPGD